MSDIVSIIVFVGGCSLFLLSLIRAAMAWQFRVQTKIRASLLKRTSALWDMPIPQRDLEFSAIKQVYKELEAESTFDFVAARLGFRKSKVSAQGTGTLGRGIL